MKKLFSVVLAWILAISLVLCGCNAADFQAWVEELDGMLTESVRFSDLTYARPDIAAVNRSAEAVQAQLTQQTDVQTLMEAVYDFYGHYHSFYTQYALANIYYCKNLTDIYWQQEYDFCLSCATEVDAKLDGLLYALADSPLRGELESEDYFGAGFFDNYAGESLWSEEFTALMAEEARLEGEYYTLSSQAAEYTFGTEAYYSACAQPMAELLVELVKVRQDIAEAAGYGDYLSFAYDFYYGRDYLPSETAGFLQDIQRQLVPIYRELAEKDAWSGTVQTCTERETFAHAKSVAQAMGGTVQQAFSRMERGGFYDISYGENKHDASFEMYLYDYEVPYVFVNPTLTTYDKLTFTHEFGHFCNDYAAKGTVASVDVAEIFSQGMEYLSLCYGAESLRKLKVLDGLAIYVEQAGYACFEQRLYAMAEPTAEKIQALFQQMGEDFGFDAWQWDSRSFIGITHFYTDPMYVMSYVVSNDAALQLYNMEQETAGAGLALYQQSLTTQQTSLLAFLEEMGLQSPFDTGRVTQVAEMFRTELIQQ